MMIVCILWRDNAFLLTVKASTRALKQTINNTDYFNQIEKHDIIVAATGYYYANIQ